MISGTTAAAAAGTFDLGDRMVNRLGFGAMRLTGTGGMGLGEDRDPEHSAEVVRRAVELGVNTSTPRASTSRPAAART